MRPSAPTCLAFDPDGKNRRIFATGIRNCVGMAVAASSGTLWCSTNERDGLGDNVPPDYITRVRDGAYYGWPWYYIGAHEDPRHAGERPDLKDKITVPDVLIQAHSASLGMTFYDATQFPAEYRGNIFAAEHGSWNRSKRTGYKIIRVPVQDGAPTGEYEDFATGFVINDSEVWGRPVGVAVDKDGALLVSEDASGTIWRITYSGKAEQRSEPRGRNRRTAPGVSAWEPGPGGIQIWQFSQASYCRIETFIIAPFRLLCAGTRGMTPPKAHRAPSSRPISRRASTPCRSGDFTSW